MEHLILKTQAINGLTDDQLFQLCVDNRDVKIERDARKDIIIMSPTGLNTGYISGEIFRQLANWNINKNLGKTFDSSTGFILPNKAMRSPDAAWLSNESYQSIPLEERNKFPHICPEFVIEVKSPSDSLQLLTGKMLEWIENGCLLAWLILPEDEKGYVYRSDGTRDVFDSFDKELPAEKTLPDFKLNLSLLRV